jgi:hypothetical protein
MKDQKLEIEIFQRRGEQKKESKWSLLSFPGRAIKVRRRIACIVIKGKKMGKQVENG